MSRFVFRLETSLRLAQARRTTLRRELAVAMKDRLIAERTVIDAEAQQAAAAAQWAADTSSGATGAELQLAEEHQAALRARLPELIEKRTVCVAREEQVREELTQASRESETLSRLRREAYDSWRQEQARQEQAAADDLVLTRVARDVVQRQGTEY